MNELNCWHSFSPLKVQIKELQMHMIIYVFVTFVFISVWDKQYEKLDVYKREEKHYLFQDGFAERIEEIKDVHVPNVKTNYIISRQILSE